MVMNGATTSAGLRAYNRVRLLRAVHDCGATRTRSKLTQDLALARGTASVLVSGLVDDRLLHEEPSAEHVRGRPTQAPGPIPRGRWRWPVDVREDSWEVAACELGGQATVLEVRRHDGTPEGALVLLGEVLRKQLGRLGSGDRGRPGRGGAGARRRPGGRGTPALAFGGRTRAARPRCRGPGPRAAGGERHGLRGPGRGAAGALAWDRGGTARPCGLRPGRRARGGRPPAGRGRRDGRRIRPHAAHRRRRALHVRSARLLGLEVGANALLRHMGLAYGGGQGRYDAGRILTAAETSADSQPDGGAALRAVATNARALGRGLAALVNAHDPAVVTLSGLGVDLYDRALPPPP